MSPGGGARGRALSFPKKLQVRRGGEIRAVLRRGRRVRAPRLDVYVLRGAAPRSRIGWVVPKLGRSAVARNLVKRRLKEIGRRRVLGRIRDVRPTADVVVRAGREAYGATYRELEDDFVSAVETACSPRS